MGFQEILKDDKAKEINNLEDIFKFIKKENTLESALVFSLDGIKLGNFENIINEVKNEKFIEGRFFNSDKEIFVFYDGEKYKAVTTFKNHKNYKEEKVDVIEREYILDKKFQNKDYKKIKVIEFIAYDKDGQAYIKASCLNEIEGDE